MSIEQNPNKTDSDENKKCSFCSKGPFEYKTLVKGPGVTICDECVDLAKERVDEDQKDDVRISSLIIPSSAEIKEYLDKFVISQEIQKEVVSVAVFDYLKEIAENPKKPDVDHILMLGPTGTGKTFIAHTLADKLDVPFVDINIAGYSTAGYVGKDIEEIFYKLYVMAGKDIKKIENKGAVIYIDEICKIAANGSNGKDVGGVGVQEALLKVIEGYKIDIKDYSERGSSVKSYIGELDTSKILFIVGGAFQGIENIISKNYSKIGFDNGDGHNTDKEYNKEKGIIPQVRPEHLIRYGILPEFVGRFPNIVPLNNLTKEDLKRILTEPEGNVLSKLKKKFKRYGPEGGIDLQVTPKAQDLIAARAEKHKTHARALKYILNELLKTDRFKIANSKNMKEFVIDAKYVKKYMPSKIEVKE